MEIAQVVGREWGGAAGEVGPAGEKDEPGEEKPVLGEEAKGNGQQEGKEGQDGEAQRKGQKDGGRDRPELAGVL